MIEAFIGLPGQGKTYNMTRKAYLKAKNYKRVIYSNYRLNFPEKDKIEVHYFKDITEIMNVNNALILVDEAGVFLPAQIWRNIPFEFLRFIRQHRHNGVDLWYTAQDLEDVAKPLRSLTQFAHNFNKLGKIVKEVTINPRNPREKYSFDYHWLSNKYFAFYDTTEIIDFSSYVTSAMKNNII